MKTMLMFLLVAEMVGTVVTTLADAAIFINNYDVRRPVYYISNNNKAPRVKRWNNEELNRLSPGRVVLIQISGAAKGDTNFVPVGPSSTFGLTEDGYFDQGYGVIRGVPDNAEVQIRIRAWIGGQNSNYESATCRTERVILQKAGRGASALKPAILEMPADFVIPYDDGETRPMSPSSSTPSTNGRNTKKR
jgi:hypothetical protein